MIQRPPTPLPIPDEWRCIECRALLARCTVEVGSVVEIKCPRCRALNVIDRRKAA